LVYGGFLTVIFMSSYLKPLFCFWVWSCTTRHEKH